MHLDLPSGVSPWIGLEMKVIGWDGSEWLVSDPRTGVFITRGGLRGWADPPVTRYTSAGPLIPGTRYRGSRTEERECFWPLLLAQDDGSLQFIERNRAWWRILDPERTVTWQVTQPSGETRSLEVRHAPDEIAFDHDPVKFGWQPYGIRLVAEQPYWQGETIRRSWTVAEEVDFFTEDDEDYVAFIGDALTLGTASIPNPGDVRAWPIWRIDGPMDSATLGVGENLIELPFALSEGEFRVIDTRPDRLLMTDENGDDVTNELGQVEFASVPPGDEVPLSIEVVGGDDGTTTVEASLTPLYRWAF